MPVNFAAQKLPFLAAIAVSLAAMSAEPANAEILRTFVSSTGNDANICTRAFPCLTLSGALAKTLSGGEINCLNSGPYGGLSIAKSVTIDCSDVRGQIAVQLAPAVTINTAGVRVILRGLDMNGVGANSATAGLAGVNFLNGASLRIDNCVIEGFNNISAGNGNGVKFAPSAGTAELVISRSRISKNGIKTSGGNGVLIQPSSSASAKVTIADSSIDDNEIGMRADSVLTTGNISVVVSNTSFAANRGGITLNGDGSGSVSVGVIRAFLAYGAVGINVVAPAVARVGDSVIIGNTTGIAGNVSTYGNNQLDGNTTQGTPTPVPLQSLP